MKIDIRSNIPEIIFIVIIFFVHLSFINIYFPYNVDDAWTLSWAYNVITNTSNVDLGFGQHATRFFKGYAYFYGFIMNLAGWTRTNGFIVSMFLGLVGVIFFYKTLIKLKFNTEFAITFCLILLYVDPFLDIVQGMRTDSLAFCLGSISLYLYASKKYFCSTIVLFLALETHPITATFAFYIIAVEYYEYTRGNKLFTKDKILKITIASILGIAYYFCLHPINISNTFTAVMGSMNHKNTVNNYLWPYFFGSNHLIHLPELVLVIISLTIYVKKKMYVKNILPLVLLISVVASTFLIRRPNFHYTIFSYPVFILIILYTFNELKLKKLLLIGVILFFGTIYTYRYHLNKNFDFNRYTQLLKSNVPENGTPIIGDSLDWFAFYDKEFYAFQNVRKNLIQRKKFSKFYIIKEKTANIKNIRVTRDIHKQYTFTKISDFTHNNKEYEIINAIFKNKQNK